MVQHLKKIKLLYILDLLERVSDENRPVALEEIQKCLAAHNIEAERKTIYNDIASLREFGYDIEKVGGSVSGWYLRSRRFEIAEIRLLSDAIQAANFISPKNTELLLNKIFSLVSCGQAKALRKQVYIENRLKSRNDCLYESIDILDTAIQTRKKVSLVYRKRKILRNEKPEFVEKTHIISPYALIWQNDHYYLVGNKAKYNNLMVMRIDRISEIKMIKKAAARPLREVSTYRSGFDCADYVNKHFYMFSGEPKPIELICQDELFENILDKFGENANVRRYGKDGLLLKTDAAVSDGLVSWIMQFGNGIRVRQPLELRDMIIAKAQQIQAVYERT